MRTNNLYTELGERHKIFRTKVLKKIQTDVVNETGLSQSTISNYDKGQLPNKEYINYLSKNGCDLHWLLTGEGEMKYGKRTVSNNNARINSINFDYELSTEPLPSFFNQIDFLRKKHFEIFQSETENQIEQFITVIEERLNQLKNSYQNI